jgi:thioredoxin 1
MESARLQPKSTSGAAAPMTNRNVTNHTPPHPQSAPASSRSDGAIQTVTTGTFTKLVLQAEGPTAVEFMSYGCAHCRTIEPVLERVAEMVAPRQKIFRVNVAVEEDLATSYQIQGTPTLVMFLNQNEVGRVEGPSPTVSSVLTAVTQPFDHERRPGAQDPEAA